MSLRVGDDGFLETTLPNRAELLRRLDELFTRWVVDANQGGVPSLLSTAMGLFGIGFTCDNDSGDGDGTGWIYTGDDAQKIQEMKSLGVAPRNRALLDWSFNSTMPAIYELFLCFEQVFSARGDGAERTPVPRASPPPTHEHHQ